jgi:cellulose synthase/poly-beta-1,6-N-acetylglucosamine synthase-like glycosyltransferase
VLDDDCFEQVIGPLISGVEDATTGSWRPLEVQTGNPFVVFQWTHTAYLEVVWGEYVASLIGRNAAIRRRALEAVGAFQRAAPIGTDLFLSNELLAGGYRIRFMRDARVHTRFAKSVGEYTRQMSRWFRNPAVLGLSDRLTTIGERLRRLRAGLAALFMLTAPIMAAVGIKMLWYPWAVMVWHLALGQARTVALAELRGVPRLQPRWRYVLFLPYMVVSWTGTARALIESMLPWRRWKW